jgi:RNA ligase (TIGR02306 family)
MSTTIITVEQVELTRPHPNADRLDIIKVLGYHVVTGRGEFKAGDKVIYFPPDILLPEHVSTDLGVTKYLKEAIYPGDTEKTKCRVSACRLRGVASYGFVIRATDVFEPGTDVTYVWGGHKYIPPVTTPGDTARDLPNFHIYTDIENIQRYPNLIPEGTSVRITEKIHGTNSRLGYVKNENGYMQCVAGSHKRRIKSEYESGTPSLYWMPMTTEMQNALMGISARCGDADVIIFCEIFGPKIQDMQYNLNKPEFRVYDISVNGTYLDYEPVKIWLERYNIPMVPILYIGPFTQEVVDRYTDGPTTFNVTTGFTGREGIVITPLKEQLDNCGNRVILKSVSVDYHNRKGAQDNE